MTSPSEPTADDINGEKLVDAVRDAVERLEQITGRLESFMNNMEAPHRE